MRTISNSWARTNWMLPAVFLPEFPTRRIQLRAQRPGGTATVYTDSQIGVDGVTAGAQEYIPNPNTLLSFFGRLNYSFDDRYLVTLSFRDDAPPGFSKQNQWVVFPAASAAWRIK